VILLHCSAQRLRNGMPNPKTPPDGWWPELVSMLGEEAVQVGVAGEPAFVPDFRVSLPLTEISRLVRECDYWIAVDSFLPHLARVVGKPGVVIWSVSDPALFGYPEHLNLLKDTTYLRAKQFQIWEQCSYHAEAFMAPAEVAQRIKAWASSCVLSGMTGLNDGAVAVGYAGYVGQGVSRPAPTPHIITPKPAEVGAKGQ
jgi:hypothetical protein